MKTLIMAQILIEQLDCYFSQTFTKAAFYMVVRFNELGTF